MQLVSVRKSRDISAVPVFATLVRESVMDGTAVLLANGPTKRLNE